MLLLHANHSVSLERLVEGIWPVQPPQSAVFNIRTYVHGLRKLLAEPSEAEPRLERVHSGYQLRVGADEVDLQVFENLAHEGSAGMAHEDFAVAARKFGTALALWRGTPLEDVPDLGEDEATLLASVVERHREVRSSLIEARIRTGDLRELMPELRTLVAQQPLDERSQAQLVEALAQSGRPAEALDSYQRARRLIVDELGVEPGPTLRAAQRAILEGGRPLSVSNSLPKPRAAESRARAGVPIGRGQPRGLPIAPPIFVGRQAVLAQIRAIAATVRNVAPPNAQATVMLISGPPGVGKSALARAAAYDVRRLFPDGQLFIDLRGSTAIPRHPADALGELLLELGAQAHEIPQTLTERSALLRRFMNDSRMLLLLDDVSSARQLVPLLPGTGGCLILASSRSTLPDLEAKWRLTLGPLEHDAAVAFLAQAAGSIEMAREPEVNRIAAACDDLPLALRIAGGRMAGLSGSALRRLASRLEDEEQVLHELALGEMSMREALLSAYHELGHEARKTLNRFSLVTGSGLVDVSSQTSGRDPKGIADRAVEELIQRHFLVPQLEKSRDEGSEWYQLSKFTRLLMREVRVAECS